MIYIAVNNSYVNSRQENRLSDNAPGWDSFRQLPFIQKSQCFYQSNKSLSVLLLNPKSSKNFVVNRSG
ncbi:hypothetical protein, partial [Faecalibaculum rodentium]|uniref:hypothetical protein n=1 Tax=Faecalibaculum rodentium TaxID=1702221 RepID=UPI0025A2BEED